MSDQVEGDHHHYGVEERQGQWSHLRGSILRSGSPTSSGLNGSHSIPTNIPIYMYVGFSFPLIFIAAS